MYSFKSQDEYKKIHHNFFLFRIFPGVWTCETKGNKSGRISFGDVLGKERWDYKNITIKVKGIPTLG